MYRWTYNVPMIKLRTKSAHQCCFDVIIDLLYCYSQNRESLWRTLYSHWWHRRLLPRQPAKPPVAIELVPNSKVHGANMGPTWGRQDPGGTHVGPMNFAIMATFSQISKRAICLQGSDNTIQALPASRRLGARVVDIIYHYTMLSLSIPSDMVLICRHTRHGNKLCHNAFYQYQSYRHSDESSKWLVESRQPWYH